MHRFGWISRISLFVQGVVYESLSVIRIQSIAWRRKRCAIIKKWKTEREEWKKKREGWKKGKRERAGTRGREKEKSVKSQASCRLNVKDRVSSVHSVETHGVSRNRHITTRAPAIAFVCPPHYANSEVSPLRSYDVIINGLFAPLNLPIFVIPWWNRKRFSSIFRKFSSYYLWVY